MIRFNLILTFGPGEQLPDVRVALVLGTWTAAGQAHCIHFCYIFLTVSLQTPFQLYAAFRNRFNMTQLEAAITTLS
jgi:hypothetical protein